MLSYVDMSAHVCLYLYLFAMSFYVLLLLLCDLFLIFKLHVLFGFCCYVF